MWDFGFWKIQICKVVDNFKLDLSVAKKKGDVD
jgi:hypothetical protein